ncbi:MAG: Ig-like domain-containing protein [Heliobacteriaceae bacterium]|nr:Ig-like domain-containing protein [Heliobacteriaceae bacterium]
MHRGPIIRRLLIFTSLIFLLSGNPGYAGVTENFTPWTGSTVTTDVPLTKEWKIIFSQPIDATSLTGNISVKTAAGANFAVEPRLWTGDSTGKTVLLSHLQPFAAGTAYTLYISKNVTARNGNATLKQGLMMAFSTAPATPDPASGKILALKAGMGQAAVLTKAGQVYSLAMHNTPYGSTPVLRQVVNLTDIVMVDCNGEGGLALDRAGDVWQYQLDRETREPGPADKLSFISGVKAIAGGGDGPTTAFTLALKTDGTVWAWGANDVYQLGTGNTQNSATPVQITSLGMDVTAISAGSYQGVALKNDGTVWHWGKTSRYQDGTIELPALVPDTGHVVKIEAGDYRNLAWREDGRVWIWGHLIPGLVPEISNPTAMTAGAEMYFPAMFVKPDGTVWSTSQSMVDGTSQTPEIVREVTGVTVLDAYFNAYYGQADGTILLQSSTQTQPYTVKLP